MSSYLWRRVLAMVPTLVGITMLTFGLLQLAPGDPVAVELEGGMRVGTVSRRVVEDFRRAYFLDLPLFVNMRPLDVRRHVDELVTQVGHRDQRQEAIARLTGLGGAALPYLVPRIPGAEGEMRQGLLTALAGIARACGLEAELAQAESPTQFWADYWRFYRLDYTSGRTRRLVRRLVRRDDLLARSELQRLHSFAFAPLIEALDDELEPEQAHRVIDVLHGIRTAGPVIGEEDDEATRRATIAAWQEWWRRQGPRYAPLGAVGRVTAMVTETQYYKWLTRLATFSFGVSQRDGRPVSTKLLEKLPTTLLLSILSVLLAYGAAVPLGVFSALKRNTILDRVVTIVLFALYSLPVFWVATVLIQKVCGLDGPALFPLGGLSSEGADSWPLWHWTLDRLHHLVLPVVCLSYVSLAALSRYQRVAMLEVLRQDYIRTAQAKGLRPRRVVIVHGLRNALLPIVTLLGMQVPYMISGAVIVERIFNIPGMGLETFDAIRNHDYHWILAVVTLSALLTMVGILLSDILYALIDPRVRLGADPRGQLS